MAVTSLRTQWPRRLRSGSTAIRLLEFRVRISPLARVPISFECCVSSGRGLCVGLITCPEESIDCGVSESDLETSIRKRLWPTGGSWPQKKKKRSCEATHHVIFLIHLLLQPALPIIMPNIDSRFLTH